jgi:translocation and assembly module TamB
VVLGLLSALVRYGPTTDAGHALIARLASGQRVGDLGWLRLQGVEGDPWSDFTVARVQIADARGVWLDARNLSARWRPGELWRREVRLTAVAARSVTVIRAPVPLPPQPQTPSPVSVRIDKANALITLGPGLAGRRGDYLLEGGADIGRDNTASGRLAAVSLARPGDFLRVGFNINRAAVGLEAHALEATGGALAGSLGLDPNQAFVLDARAHGSARSGWFTFSTTVGKTSPAQASGQWSPAGGQASGRLDLTASRWLAPWRKGLGDRASFALTAARVAGNLYRVAFDGRGANIEVTARGDLDPARRRAGPGGIDLGATVRDLSALAGVPGLGAARLTGRWTGDEARWRLAGTAAVEKAQAAGFSLSRLQGPFQLDSAPAGLTLKAQATGVGGAGTSPVAVLLGAAPGGEFCCGRCRSRGPRWISRARASWDYSAGCRFRAKRRRTTSAPWRRALRGPSPPIGGPARPPGPRPGRSASTPGGGAFDWPRPKPTACSARRPACAATAATVLPV